MRDPPSSMRVSLVQLCLSISTWNPNIFDPVKVVHSDISPVSVLALSWNIAY